MAAHNLSSAGGASKQGGNRPEQTIAPLAAILCSYNRSPKQTGGYTAPCTRSERELKPLLSVCTAGTPCLLPCIQALPTQQQFITRESIEIIESCYTTRNGRRQVKIRLVHLVSRATTTLT